MLGEFTEKKEYKIKWYALCELSLAELRSLLLKGQHINIKTLS